MSEAIRVGVSPRPLAPEEMLASVTSEGDGATLLFTGTVRDHNRERPVLELTYETYREMAEAELGRIAEEALERFEISRIFAVHRTGSLEPGEASVATVVAAPHRQPCYEASRYLIEELKRRLPIWKRERYADGSSEWLGGEPPPEPDGGADPGKGSETEPRPRSESGA